MTATPITDMVRKLLEKGVGHDALLIAIEAAEQAIMSADVRGLSVDVQAERRREKDRLRKRMERETPRNSADVRGIPQMSEDASLYSKERDSLFLEREAPQSERPRTSRGHRLPDDWEPSPQDRVTGEALLGAERFSSELEKFHDHWKQQAGQRGVKLDWNAAWRNWCRRAAEFGGRNGRPASQDRTNTAAGRANSREADFIAAVARGALRVVGNGAAKGSVGEISEGPGVAEGPDPERDRAWVDFEARGGTR